MAARAEGKVTPPFGQFPYVETDDGACLAQSGTLVRWAGKKAGLYPAGEFAGYEAEALLDQINDCAAATYGPMFATVASEEERQKLKDAAFKEKLPNLFKGVIAQLKKSGGPYLFGAEPTFADITLFAFAEGFAQRNYDWLSVAPEFKTIVDGLASHPKLAAYLQKRAEVEAAEAAAAAK
jgi:glutathione S-transferase